MELDCKAQEKKTKKQWIKFEGTLKDAMSYGGKSYSFILKKEFLNEPISSKVEQFVVANFDIAVSNVDH